MRADSYNFWCSPELFLSFLSQSHAVRQSITTNKARSTRTFLPCSSLQYNRSESISFTCSQALPIQKLLWYLVQVSLAIGSKWWVGCSMHQELVNLVWLTHSVQGLLVAASDRMFIHFTTLPAPTWCKTNKLLKTNFIYECSYHDASICCCVASQASLPIFLFFYHA